MASWFATPRVTPLLCSSVSRNPNTDWITKGTVFALHHQPCVAATQQLQTGYQKLIAAMSTLRAAIFVEHRRR
jgi:hypothetical protein